MAFSLENFEKISAGGSEAVRKIFGYTDTSETLANIAASAFFNPVDQFLTIGDTLKLRGSDGVAEYDVTAVSPNVTVAGSAASIPDDSITDAMLAPGIQSSGIIRGNAQYTTTGGAAAEAITLTGIDNTYLAFVQLVDGGTSTVSVVKAVVTADTLTITFSADPGNDAIVNYMLVNDAS